jgi:lipoyl(octanoyl) transferase
MPDIIIRQYHSPQPYQTTWEAMQQFTQHRHADTTDEIWLMAHLPVFTQGLAGKAEHVLNPHDIPVVQTDRGGQVTYHGPGQLMAYLLFDLKRLGLSTRTFVRTIEQTIVAYLQAQGITAAANPEAPGVYVNGAKICSIGLRVRNGYSYHGLAFNIDMDLTPFSFINPCGFKDLAMTQLRDFLGSIDLNIVMHDLIPYFLNNFRYNQPHVQTEMVGSGRHGDQQASL